MQMLDNAKFYNEEGSLVWMDAEVIRNSYSVLTCSSRYVHRRLPISASYI